MTDWTNQDGTARVLLGNVLSRLPEVPDGSVQCCVTSPPYWGLRSYLPDGHEDKPLEIGTEKTPEAYVANLVAVFREVRRTLRNDATLWLNLGDCYATGAGSVGNCPGGGAQGNAWKGYRGTREGSPKHTSGAMGPMTQPNRMPIDGLKPKDLVGIPWRVAFALQADGWYLRSDIVWAKRNCMPESVTDRPTKSHEYIFLLAKQERYCYDHEAIKEPHGYNRWTTTKQVDASVLGAVYEGQCGKTSVLRAGKINPFPEGGRNKRSVWSTEEPEPDRLLAWMLEQPEAETLLARYAAEQQNKPDVWDVPTKSFKEAHFATFPPDLIEPCVLAGCPEGATVLDPFSGSGTTGEVAIQHGRRYLGVELNPEYLQMSARRLARATRRHATPLLASQTTRPRQAELFGAPP